MKAKQLLRINAELAVMIGLLVLIDVKSTGGTAFAALNPNPLWLPVLAMALGYGSGMGLLAAGMASAYWFAMPHAAMALDEDPFHYMLARSLPPLMWVAASVLVGELTYVRQRRIASLERHGRRTEDDLATATNAFRLASENAHALQVRIAVDEVGVGRAIEAATGLFDPDRGRLPQTMSRLVAMDAQAQDFTIYTPVAGSWRAFAQGQEASGRPDYLAGALVDAILATPQAVTLADPGAGALLGRIGVMALPARDARATVRAILMFHHLEPERFSRRGIVDLDAVASRLAALLAVLPADVSSNQPPRFQVAITSDAA
ncbi:hypothetical protein [Sphingomonas mollis]|uniref:GAF domain-containing protein n=1 Tax=Sphingomonas mollis TaxID=2795726 RepID=A0ABS0XU39_9SPHN|nr:hypothetical protein [Sphingomonas sp. BT553]MBJ6123245.1 hypothetical protein [Sphingomonas sp. BT553]